MYVEKACC